MRWRRRRHSAAELDPGYALAQARAVESDLRDVLSTLRTHLNELESELGHEPTALGRGGDDA